MNTHYEHHLSTNHTWILFSRYWVIAMTLVGVLASSPLHASVTELPPFAGMLDGHGQVHNTTASVRVAINVSVVTFFWPRRAREQARESGGAIHSSHIQKTGLLLPAKRVVRGREGQGTSKDGQPQP
jgi:hypothetical protein